MASLEFYPETRPPPAVPNMEDHRRYMVKTQVEELVSTGITSRKDIASSMTLNSDASSAIEKMTRGQAGNTSWHELRRCRLTASNFKAIMSSKTSDGGSLARQIVDGVDFGDNLPAPLEWGRKKEKVALEFYSRVQRQSHRGHKLDSSGLVVMDNHAYIGASPDGISTCKCKAVHSRKLVEVKCPYSFRIMNAKDAAKEKGLKEGSNGELQMDNTCPYFPQVQGQMGVCRVDTCDLVVYTAKGITVVPVQFDNQYFMNMLEKLHAFFVNIILSKIM